MSRPSETVLDILPNPNIGPLRKGRGGVVRTTFGSAASVGRESQGIHRPELFRDRNTPNLTAALSAIPLVLRRFYFLVILIY
jgi:hypothetical protein